MNLHLQPKQFLLLYNCIKRYENEYLSPNDQEAFDSVMQTLESAILDAFENLEARAAVTGFDKWVKSETNKIQGLEEEIKKIKETTSPDALLSMFAPVKKNISSRAGRPKKKV